MTQQLQKLRKRQRIGKSRRSHGGQPIVAVKKLWRLANNGCRCYGTLREKVSGDEKRKRDSELHNSGWFADIIEESQVELDIMEQEKRKKSKREGSKERKAGKQGLNWT